MRVQTKGVPGLPIATSPESESRANYLPLFVVAALLRMTSVNGLSPAWVGAPAFYVCQLVGMVLSAILVGHFPG
jgi:hypothetical protein